VDRGLDVTDPYGPGCDDSAEIYAASQAMPIRRVAVVGSLVLQDYCSPTGYVSGGFLGDSVVTGTVDFYGQQQYLVEDSDIGGASNSVWNMVYTGVRGAPSPQFAGTGHQVTVLARNPRTEGPPFLAERPGGALAVFVPAERADALGPAWSAQGPGPGRWVSLQRFLVATPATPLKVMNAALARGADLLLTPGVYSLSGPIVVSRPGSIVLGLGFATLVPRQGTAALEVTSDHGVKVTGLIVDAGPKASSVLLSLGHPGQVPGGQRGAGRHPDLLADVFFRVGGPSRVPVDARVSLLDAADGSILSDVWAWRADHGNDVGWDSNRGATGVLVSANDVTAEGLAVEHYQRDEVIWQGQGGRDVFFQNELPYDPPDQAAWMAGPTQDGYPAFLVAPQVRSFAGYGMGSYAVFIDTQASVFDQEAFAVPTRPGVVFSHVFDLFIAGPPDGAPSGIRSVIDGVGGPATAANADQPVDVVRYPPTLG
jgi:hypothetical protein